MNNIIEKLGITKAPWKWEIHEEFDCMVDSEGDEIINDGSAHGEYCQVITADSANAKLIATAPEMLKVLIKSVLLEEKIIREYHPTINIRESIQDKKLYIKEKNGQEALQDLVDKIEAIEQATDKSWEEIKELINEH